MHLSQTPFASKLSARPSAVLALLMLTGAMLIEAMLQAAKLSTWLAVSLAI
jgi:hypothetical protein